MRKLFRADDFGSCRAANDAILDVLRGGIVRNVSVMIPAPSIEYRLDELIATPSIDIGLHVTLNSEWDNLKWGPVSDPKDVPSLLEGQFFTAFPQVLHNRGFRLDEVEREIEAQFNLGARMGVPFAYVDEHMGVGRLAGVSDVISRFAARRGLVYLPNIHENLPLQVFHPCYESEESLQFIHAGLAPGQVARERTEEARSLCAMTMTDVPETPVRYSDVGA